MIIPRDTIDSLPYDCRRSRATSIQEWLQGLEYKCCGLRTMVRSTRSSGRVEIGSGPAKRQREFLAGRRCATQLLRELGEYQDVGVNDDRSPAWPVGFVGSISHSELWTMAAVAPAADLRSIGIDTEPVMSTNCCEKLSSLIATQAEKNVLLPLGLSPESALTLIFSAKESFYKCWYPISKRFIEFLDVVVSEVTETSLTIEPVSQSSTTELALGVRYHVGDQSVFTATWLENQK